MVINVCTMRSSLINPDMCCKKIVLDEVGGTTTNKKVEWPAFFFFWENQTPLVQVEDYQKF